MNSKRLAVTRAWGRLSIKYKIVIISASLITLRLFLNGNYFLGYQQLEKYHEFEHHIHRASYELYNFKSNFSEIFFTNGALPQLEQTRQRLQNTINTIRELRQHHDDVSQFQPRIGSLEERVQELQGHVERVLQTPEILNLNNDEGMIVLGRVTAMSNHLFSDIQRLIEDVTVYSGQMRDEIFRYMLSMGTAIFCVGILFLIMLYRGVMGPLKLLEEMRKLIQRVHTEGDLSGKLQAVYNNPEVGRLASDFNALISSLNANLGKTSQTVTLVAEHVERLSSEVRESHDEISQQQHEIFHLNNAIRKMAETLQVLAENANRVADSATELEGHCREGEGVMEQMRRINQSLEQHINSALQQIEKIQSDVPPGIGEGQERLPLETGDTPLFGNAMAQLQVYSKEAANSIRFATAGLNEHRTTLQSAERPATMIRQLSESIDDCTRQILATIETEKQVLQTITRDVDEIATIENHASFTSKLITSASDELLYLSKLLSAEVQRYHTKKGDVPQEEQHQGG